KCPAKQDHPNIPFILIINPTVGDLQGPSGGHFISHQLIDSSLNGYTNYHLGIIITSITTVEEIDEYLQQYPDHTKVFIHKGHFRDTTALKSLISNSSNIVYNVFHENKTSAAYRAIFTSIPKVLLRDGFSKENTNADYSETDMFSDLHNVYDDLNFQGFGDFLTIGDDYTDKGGIPSVIAIHLTYLDGEDLHVAHFLSDVNSRTRANIAGKFSEALSHLINFVNSRGMASQTLGIREFEYLHARQHFPNLGPVKKMSMKHHIELISSIL
ncbi:sce7725 family protein, partial [Arsenicibacter rosenii]